MAVLPRRFRREPPPEPERSVEPVEGWRAWRLRRDGRGELSLVPAFHGVDWPPRQAVRAECQIHGRRHRAPERKCSCGLYAIPDAALIGSISDGLGVVGQVSLWGRVVEHEYGYRAEFAYPSRLRLVCSPCLVDGERPAAPDRVVFNGEYLLPVCDRHAEDVKGKGFPEPASEVESELLDAYAVELLPGDALPPAGASPEFSGPVGWLRRRRRGLRPSAWAKVLIAFILIRGLVIALAVSPVTGLGGDSPPGNGAPAAGSEPGTARAGVRSGARSGFATRPASDPAAGTSRAAKLGEYVPKNEVYDRTPAQLARPACGDRVDGRILRTSCYSPRATLFVSGVIARGVPPGQVCAPDTVRAGRLDDLVVCWAETTPRPEPWSAD